MSCCDKSINTNVKPLSDEQFEAMFLLKDLLDLIGQFRNIDKIGFNAETIKAIVKLLKALTNLTGTKLDDNLVDFLDKVVADERFLEVVKKLFDWFGTKNGNDSDEIVVI